MYMGGTIRILMVQDTSLCCPGASAAGDVVTVVSNLGTAENGSEQEASTLAYLTLTEYV